MQLLNAPPKAPFLDHLYNVSEGLRHLTPRQASPQTLYCVLPSDPPLNTKKNTLKSQKVETQLGLTGIVAFHPYKSAEKDPKKHYLRIRNESVTQTVRFSVLY